ncbi:MAG: carbohydrate ABC transporter permease [Clostridiales bacterium]|nr:carbohydrate ABC transporter permease [Clostridiales bacterium]
MSFKEKWKNGNTRRTLVATNNAFGWISFFVLFVYAFSFLFPFIWSVITSFRDPMSFLMERFEGYGIFPKDWFAPTTWANNYQTVLKTLAIPSRNPDGSLHMIGIGEMISNSLLYAVGCTAFSVLTCLLVAYAVAMFNFKYCKIMYTVIIIQMILPIVGSFPSQIRMATALNLYDSIPGMWIMSSYVSGLYFLVFHGAFKLIPKDYAEAAHLDGAGNFRVMVSIMVPFVKGSIFTIALMKFIGLWNDYMAPYLYMPTHPTISYGVYWLTVGSRTGDTPTQLAATTLLAVPLLAFFIAFQKQLLGDLTVGGLK